MSEKNSGRKFVFRELLLGVFDGRCVSRYSDEETSVFREVVFRYFAIIVNYPVQIVCHVIYIDTNIF